MPHKNKVKLNSLDEVTFQPLTFEGLERSILYLEENIEDKDEDDELVEIYLTMTQRIMYTLEIEKESDVITMGEKPERLEGEKPKTSKFTKGSNKNLERRLIKSIEKMRTKERTIETIYQFLLSLPMTMRTRWNMLAALVEFDLIDDVSNQLFAELSACASEQDLSCRCDEFLFEVASRVHYRGRTARLLHRALTTPIRATRESVLRGWIGRLVKREDKSAETEENTKRSMREACLERLLDTCREGVLRLNQNMWPVPFREISGITVLDLEWSGSKDQEPYDMITYNMMTYFSVLLACAHQGSRLKLQLRAGDEVLTGGVIHADDNVAQNAIIVCSKYGCYPKTLNEALKQFKGHPSRQLIECLKDEKLVKHFCAETSTHLCSYQLQNDPKEVSDTVLPKKWVDPNPAEEDPRNSRPTFSMNSSADRPDLVLKEGLRKMHREKSYPSVAEATEHLKTINLDIRVFCEELLKFVVDVNERFKDKSLEKKKETIFPVLFLSMSRCPFRIFIDSVLPLLKLNCSDKPSREYFHREALHLLKEKEHNTRPLVLELIFEITCAHDQIKMYLVWTTVWGHTNIEKKEIMSVMVSKVISSKEITVAKGPLFHMINCAFGFDNNFPVRAPQLLVSAVSKLLKFRVENERIMLFKAFSDQDDLHKLLGDIVGHGLLKSGGYDRDVVYLVLYMLGRFQLGAFCFYTKPQLRVIRDIIRFCRKCIWEYRTNTMILGMAVDAICGFLPWEYITDRALDKAVRESGDPIEELVKHNLNHHYLYRLVRDHEIIDEYVTIDDLREIPKAGLIVEVLEMKDRTNKNMDILADKVNDSIIDSIVPGQEDPDQLQADSFAFGLLCEAALMMIDKAKEEKKKEKINWKTYLPTGEVVEILNEIEARIENIKYKPVFADCFLAKGLARFRWLEKRKNELIRLDDIPDPLKIKKDAPFFDQTPVLTPTTPTAGPSNQKNKSNKKKSGSKRNRH